MPQVLYLGVEGVLFMRPGSTKLQSWRHQTPRATPLPLLPAISRVLADVPNVSVVINSRLVAEFGYRGILNLLPEEIARATIGATMPGNRVHRRDAILSRADYLRADIRRRRPSHLVIVDASPYAIPYEYIAQSVRVKKTGTDEANEIAGLIKLLLEEGADTTEDNFGLLI
ncbi:hypothetical protein X992_5490 [Burkholderia pseudomallei MSHR5492]|uniref:HAD domain-containing protein n=1 Tax=Burkholderia pseudomallei TaxID=28450 RepID=UPI00053145FB|nr:HAD domain-containing protein [Burkholderia pseudomallei]KGS38273.1 hypothetical protein X992_5490 [Burkholderia pseudomallei MSHR5492]KGW77340.1 hypothetical protein Y046_2104 [Burkholderia pseudomallei MSHR2990]ONC21772.1 hypothetical protein AQ913_15100 [Burkholderia pseudomallei]